MIPRPEGEKQEPRAATKEAAAGKPTRRSAGGRAAGGANPAPARQAPAPEEAAAERPVIRDKRRVDPESGQVREPQAAAVKDAAEPSGAATATEGDDQLRGQLAERTADLQRLQAEYANYRKRVDRDRENAREIILASVLGELLPVLDDIGRARDHGELEGGFKGVGESLEQVATKLGLQPFGEVGEAFDPMVHEALMHSYSPDVAETTCVAVLQPGYRLGQRVIRPARVAVAEPESGGE